MNVSNKQQTIGPLHMNSENNILYTSLLFSYVYFPMHACNMYVYIYIIYTYNKYDIHENRYDMIDMMWLYIISL